MPLKDRDRTRPRRLVRLGVIRLGHKEKKTRRGRGGKTYEVEYPVQDDHFVLTDAPELAEVYGDEPREIDVILPLPEVRQNFDAWYQVWAGGVLLCKGDGEFVQYAAPHELIERQGKRVSVRNAAGDTLISDGAAQIAFEWNGAQFEPGELVPCPGAAQDLYPHCVACSKAAILKVMMADPRLFRLGYYQLSTGSGRNYDTILGTLELIHSQAGQVNGIPFKLRLVEEQATYTEGGKRKVTTKWFLQLEPDPTFTRQLYRKVAHAAISDEPVAALPERIEEGELVVIDEVEGEAPPTLADAPEEEWDEEVFDAVDEPEAETESEPEPTRAAPRPSKDGRPYPPETIRNAIENRIAKAKPTAQDGIASPGQKGLVAGKLEECFAPADDATLKRRSVLGWLIDRHSVQEMTIAEASAILDWLLDKNADEGTFDLHPAAGSEAAAILAETLCEAGQQELAF